jgi:hypothetical protein
VSGHAIRVAGAALAIALFAGCAAGPAPASTSEPSRGSGAPAAPDSTACPTFGVRLELASDRLVDVALAGGPDSDRATFRFGARSPGPSAADGAAEAILGATTPPFSQAATGSAFDVSGSRFAEIRFIGMTLADAAGGATFVGPRDTETELAALRQLTVYEEGSGVIAWVIGIDGGGCVTLAPMADGSLVLDVAHR